MSGPIRIVLGIIGAIGNIVSIIIFTRPHMTKSDVNFVLIGKYQSLHFQVTGLSDLLSPVTFCSPDLQGPQVPGQPKKICLLEKLKKLSRFCLKSQQNCILVLEMELVSPGTFINSPFGLVQSRDFAVPETLGSIGPVLTCPGTSPGLPGTEKSCWKPQ